MFHWSSSCIEHHRLCKPLQDQKEYHLPTRLLDLHGLHNRLPSDGVIVLVNASDIERNELYATLSHRWER